MLISAKNVSNQIQPVKRLARNDAQLSDFGNCTIQFIETGNSGMTADLG